MGKLNNCLSPGSFLLTSCFFSHFPASSPCTLAPSPLSSGFFAMCRPWVFPKAVPSDRHPVGLKEQVPVKSKGSTDDHGSVRGNLIAGMIHVS